MPKPIAVTPATPRYKRDRSRVEITGVGPASDRLRAREQCFYWLERLLLLVLKGILLLLLCKARSS